jgi:hypothetical protein
MKMVKDCRVQEKKCFDAHFFVKPEFREILVCKNEDLI